MSISFYRDAVAVVYDDELAQLPQSGKARGFVLYALHHAAVAAESVCIMIHERAARTVEPRRKHPLGERHAHGVGYSLPQRTRRTVHARSNAVLGMPRSAAAFLPESREILRRHVVTAYVQRRIQHRRCMPRTEHEPVAVVKFRIFRNHVHKSAVKRRHYGRRAERRARMSAVCGLHLPRGQHPDRFYDVALCLFVHSHCSRSLFSKKLYDILCAMYRQKARKYGKIVLKWNNNIYTCTRRTGDSLRRKGHEGGNI